MKTETKRGPGRPALPIGDKKERVNFALYPKTHLILRKRAGAQKVSMSELLTELIEGKSR